MKGQFKVFDIFSLLLKPEKCSECEEWMNVYKTYDNGHESLQRMCDCNKEKKASNRPVSEMTQDEILESVFGGKKQ